MSLEHAVLVSLSERPGTTGYDLNRRFSRSVGFFWPTTHQQLYKVLRQMDEKGWVTHREQAGEDGRPDKKVYEVTKAGRTELARWLSAPTDGPGQRDAFALKVRGASLGDVAAVIEEAARHRAGHALRLAGFLEFQRHDFPEPETLSGQRLHQYLVLLGGIRAEQARVEWLDEVMAALRADRFTPNTES